MRYGVLRFVLLAFVALMLLPNASLAQAKEVTLYEIDDTRFPDIDVVISASEGRAPLSGLTAENFTLVEDGLIVPVQNVTTLDESEVGISLLLVLDTSTSMASNAGLENAKAAALSILNRLDDNDQVALLAFGGALNVGLDNLDPTREIPFTSDKETVRQAIQSLQANGGTPLYDATIKGVRLAADAQRGSRAMILLTDGRDERLEASGSVAGSLFTDTDAIAEARDAALPIYTIGLGENIDETFLQRLADQSGGSFSKEPDAAQLEGAFNDVLDKLLERYVVSYVSQVDPDTGTHALFITVKEGGEQASVTGTFASQAPDTPGVRLELEEGEEIADVVRVRPTVFAADDIASVELLIDGEVVAKDSNRPYSLTWRSGLPAGSDPVTRMLAVRATDTEGDSGERAVQVLVLAQPVPTTTPIPSATPIAPPIRTGLLINEVLPQPDQDWNGDGTIDVGDQYVELINRSSESIDLSKVRILTESGSTVALVGTLEPGSLVVYYRSTSGLEMGESTDTIRLLNTDNSIIDEQSYSGAPLGRVFGLPRVGDEWRPIAGTPGELNSEEQPNWLLLLLLLGGLLLFLGLIWRLNRRSDDTFVAPTDYVPPPPLPSSSPIPTLTPSTVGASPSRGTLEFDTSGAPPDTTVLLKRNVKALAYLAELDGARSGYMHRVESEKITLGRGSNAQIRLSDPTAGREQATIRRENGQFYLYDLAASNPTLLNGQQVIGRAQLDDRDVITIGQTRLQFLHIQAT